MKEAVSRSLYSYWNNLRRDRIAPKRFEIEPSAIATYLPDTFILERFDHATLRFRLAGTRISEAFGIEFRGLNLLDLFDAADVQILQRQIALITSQGAVGVFRVAADSVAGLSAEFEIVLLPLTHTREVVDRFLGSVAVVDRPSWLGTVALRRRKLIGHDIFWPDGRPRGLIDDRERQTPFLPMVREARIVRSDRRQFRVYEGGRSGDER